MSRRKYRLPPPTSSAHKSGQVLTFADEGDPPAPSELVELRPVGPAPMVIEFRPEHDKVRTQCDCTSEQRVAVIRYFELGYVLESRCAVALATTHEHVPGWNPSMIPDVTLTEPNLLRLLGELNQEGIIDRSESPSPRDTAESIIIWRWRG